MLIYFEIDVELPNPIQISGEHSEYKWVSSITEIEVDGGTKEALKAIFSSS